MGLPHPFCGGMPRFKAHLRDGRRKLADVDVDVRGLASLSLACFLSARRPAPLLALPLTCCAVRRCHKWG